MAIFLKKLVKILEGAILTTADVAGLSLSLVVGSNIPHGIGLEALRKRLNERETWRVPTEELIKMVDFVLKKQFL